LAAAGLVSALVWTRLSRPDEEPADQPSQPAALRRPGSVAPRHAARPAIAAAPGQTPPTAAAGQPTPGTVQPYVTPASPPDYSSMSSLRTMSPEERARLLAAASFNPSVPPETWAPPGHRSASVAPQPMMIHGYVREVGGAAVAGASLTLIDPAGGQIGRGVTGADGSYRLPVPSAGSYFLIARARSHHPQATTVDVAGQPVSLAIVLTGLAALTGVVRVGAGQEPIPSALVTLLDQRGEVIDSTSTDHHGRFRFAELVGGSYTLAASASPFRPTARHVTVSDTGTSAYDIELQAGAYLRGTTVAGPRRRPYPDAKITLLDAEGNVIAVTNTDEAGEYIFADVPEGDYLLRTTSYLPVTTKLRVLAGQKHEHNVELRHADD
jgi:hypothetical protein